jgi:hypothetical protein
MLHYCIILIKYHNQTIILNIIPMKILDSGVVYFPVGVTECHTCDSVAYASCPHCLLDCCHTCFINKHSIDCKQCHKTTCKFRIKKCRDCHRTEHLQDTINKICCQCDKKIKIAHKQQVDQIKKAFCARLSHPSKIVFAYVDDDIPIDYSNKSRGSCIIL